MGFDVKQKCREWTKKKSGKEKSPSALASTWALWIYEASWIIEVENVLFFFSP